MGLLDDIKTLIPSDAAEASSVFLGSYPDSPDNIVTLYRSGGFDRSRSFTNREYENPSVQVRVRDISYARANDKMEIIKDALDGLTEQSINGNRYLSIMQQGDVLPLGRDDKNRTELSLNFRVRVERNA